MLFLHPRYQQQADARLQQAGTGRLRSTYASSNAAESTCQARPRPSSINRAFRTLTAINSRFRPPVARSQIPGAKPFPAGTIIASQKLVPGALAQCVGKFMSNVSAPYKLPLSTTQWITTPSGGKCAGQFTSFFGSVAPTGDFTVRCLDPGALWTGRGGTRPRATARLGVCARDARHQRRILSSIMACKTPSLVADPPRSSHHATGNKCTKCNLSTPEGGCACDSNCDCKGK